VSREQFERVRPLLEGVRKRTKPRTVDLYEVFNAVLYLLKSGCQWRMLPNGFPKWRTVHSYFAGQPFADGVKERLEATVQIVKRNELHTFAVLPKRWVVERSFWWLEKCRRLRKNCERKLNTSVSVWSWPL
jgi:transposase